MGWLQSKTKPAAASTPEAVVVSLGGTHYFGDPKAVIFREGFHYPALFDTDGNEVGPDLASPLVWRDGGYLYAKPDDPNHFHTYGLNAVDLDPGAE